MLTPSYLLHAVEPAEEIAERLHTDIINRIVDRIIARFDRGDDYILTAVDKWNIETLQEVGFLLEDIQKEIAKATGLMQSEIAQAMEDAGVKALEYDDAIYKAAGLDPVPLTQSPYMMQLLQDTYEKTMGEWRNFTGISKRAIHGLYVDACDTAYMQVMSGALSSAQAVREALEKIVEGGVYVKYPGGRKDTIETATARAVRTGISQGSARIQLARMDEMGVELVLVSSHMGARPEHALWQGKVYSRSGATEKYADFVAATGYGSVTGLCGANCRHNFGPYFEGMENPFEQYDTEENRKQYELEQRQQAMERNIRNTKRETMGWQNAAEKEKDPAKKALFEAEHQKKSALLQKQNKAYNVFCEETGQKRRAERLHIAKWDRQQAAKARGAARKTEKRVEKSPVYSVGTPKTDLEYINSDKYKNKFKNITEDPNLNQIIYKYSKAAVTHQSGSFNEDLTVISLDGKHIETTSNKKPYETMYTQSLKEAIKESKPYSLFAIHNHGTNVPPSGADLVSAGEKKYAFGIVACHNGSVYYYSCKNAKPFLPELMDKTVDKFRRKPYNMGEVDAYKKALDQMAADYGIEWRELI